MKAKRRDWKFRAAVALSGLFLIAALASGLYLVSGGYVPDMTLPAPVGALQPDQSSVIFGPVILLLLAVALFLVARWVHLRNRSMWPDAGCPSCRTGRLVRVHRTASNRLLALSGIPTGRYLCTTCHWKGRRVPRGPVHLSNMIGSQASPADFAAVLSARPESPSRGVGGPLLPAEPAGELWEAERAPAAPHRAAAAFSTDGLNGNTVPAHRAARNGQTDGAGMAGPLGLKLRETPRVQETPISSVEPGAAVVILERARGEDGRTWQLVQANGRKGWVIGMFVKE